MKFSLLAMDLDGTALQPDGVSFSPRLMADLYELHRRGILVVPTTGRPYAMLPPVLKEKHDWLRYAIVCDGSEIRRMDTRECVQGYYLPRQTIQKLVDLADTFDLPLEISAQNQLYLTRKSWQMQQPYAQKIPHHVHTILSQFGVISEDASGFAADFGGKADKVNLPVVEAEKKERVLQALSELPIQAVWCGSNSLEITHPEASKGKTLTALCRLLQIPLEQTFAMGDSGNDLSMLQSAGFSVAMGNAPDFVKQSAMAVTDTNVQDGAAKAIETYLL